MSKIRSKSSSNKISGSHDNDRACCSEQYPWFSFAYLTKNDKYNLKRMPAGKDREKVLWNLFCRLEELSNLTWKEWHSKHRHIGLEMIGYDELNFAAGPGANLSKDSKIYVFRFDTHLGSEKGRILGYKDSPCSVLHIIGYDLDFSAYNHGS